MVRSSTLDTITTTERHQDPKLGDAGFGRSAWRCSSTKVKNLVYKVSQREISNSANASFKNNNYSETFSNISLKMEFDIETKHKSKLCSWLQERSMIVEILSAHSLLFVLSHSGVCTSLDLERKETVGLLNIAPDEVIRSLFYNKANNSLVTVSVFRCDNFSSLKCRTIPIPYIRRGKPDMGFSLFESEALSWPGFVEFDDVNNKVLTYSACEKIYKVWDLTNYTLLYQVSDQNISEIKISPGVMLLIYALCDSTHVPLKIVEIQTGEVLKSFCLTIHKDKKIDFIEQFNEKILIKQENHNLQILDLRTSLVIEVNHTDFVTPSAFIFLSENHTFLTFHESTVTLWNFRGELVARFEDHLLWVSECSTNTICITAQQDLIISLCKSETGRGTINISDIMTGKCLAKIGCDKPGSVDNNITALFFNEQKKEIYTGNKNGIIQVWSN